MSLLYYIFWDTLQKYRLEVILTTFVSVIKCLLALM